MRIADIDIQKVYEDLYNKAGLWYISIYCLTYILLLIIFKEFI